MKLNYNFCYYTLFLLVIVSVVFVLYQSTGIVQACDKIHEIKCYKYYQGSGLFGGVDHARVSCGTQHDYKYISYKAYKDYNSVCYPRHEISYNVTEG